MKNWWREALSPQQLRLRAGRRTFERGEDYLKTDRVLSTQWIGDALTAQVQGTIVYEVRFWRKGRELLTDCTCPFAWESAFCKHAVAVALAADFDGVENDFPAS